MVFIHYTDNKMKSSAHQRFFLRIANTLRQSPVFKFYHQKASIKNDTQNIKKLPLVDIKDIDL